MKPYSFSASALNTAELCMSRYLHENLNRSKGAGNSAANLGTSVHGALEMYVKNCIIDNKINAGLQTLLDFYKLSYMETFRVSECVGQDYEDGKDMLRKWHARTDFSQFEVISCEIKESFPMPTSEGDIPFNYIWDRFDKIGENTYRVVDYKTNRWGINPDDLRSKIQARCYGLAAQIKYPNADRIWVQFDMLRHDGPVGIGFSREDNIATWKFLKGLTQKIIDTDPKDAQETLNPECGFCVKLTTCGAARKNIDAGGILSIGSAERAIDIRAELDYQMKAAKKAIDAIDAMIIEEAKATEIFEWESESNKMFLGVSRNRAVDADMAERVVGPDIFNKYGGKSLSIANVDKLLKDPDLTPEQKSQLSGLIYKKVGEARVKIKPANPVPGA
jgi:RecB family exonuclease